MLIVLLNLTDHQEAFQEPKRESKSSAPPEQRVGQQNSVQKEFIFTSSKSACLTEYWACYIKAFFELFQYTKETKKTKPIPSPLPELCRTITLQKHHRFLLKDQIKSIDHRSVSTSLPGWQGYLQEQVPTKAKAQTHPSVPPELSNCFCTTLHAERSFCHATKSIVPLLK